MRFLLFQPSFFVPQVLPSGENTHVILHHSVCVDFYVSVKGTARSLSLNVLYFYLWTGPLSLKAVALYWSIQAL